LVRPLSSGFTIWRRGDPKLTTLPQFPASPSVRRNYERERLEAPTFRLSTLTSTDRNYLMPREHNFFSGGLKFLLVTKLQHQMHSQSYCPNGVKGRHCPGALGASGIPRCLHLQILEGVLKAPTSSKRTKHLSLVLLVLSLDVLAFFAPENLQVPCYHRNEWAAPEPLDP